MALTGTRTYVGFGFGAIQAGLFLYEAFQSGAFRRLVVAEVMPDMVTAVRRANGYFTVNIARPDGVEKARVGPIEIDDPAQDADRQHIIDAIAHADEIGTAIPSVAYYASAAPGSLHSVLAQGLRKKAEVGGPRAVIYTAENHNHAAEILEEKVVAEIPARERAGVRSCVRFLNTVIGKMSGVVTDPGEIKAQALAPITPEDRRAFLVESFNRILISRIDFDTPFQRGLSVFEEKADLLPFEEAKLYGHNATHALAAYLGAVRGLRYIAELEQVPGVLPFLRAAFIEESGGALIRKHTGVDALFTPEGYTHYADDLLSRMFNPYLRDTVERVGRDPARKLGWDDRLIGTMRLALSQGIQPRRYAVGAAAALATLDRAVLDGSTSIEPLLTSVWGDAISANERRAVLELIEDGRGRLQGWRASGFRALE
jgi:mannitol-1-phosphate 5-dehydrogenase